MRQTCSHEHDDGQGSDDAGSRHGGEDTSPPAGIVTPQAVAAESAKVEALNKRLGLNDCG
jgi:hypothetical protein